MTTFFITGTDTNVGKTVATGLLARHFQSEGHTVLTQKWVQTGAGEDKTDIQVHCEYMGLSEKKIAKHLPMMMPYTLTLPASAHLAAAEENITINIAKLTQSLRYLESQADICLVEGLGGVNVPLTASFTTLDLLERLKLNTIVVVENKVGAINHALLTLEAIANRHIPITGFITVNKDTSCHPKILADNPRIIESFSGVSQCAEILDPQTLVLHKPLL